MKMKRIIRFFLVLATSAAVSLAVFLVVGAHAEAEQPSAGQGDQPPPAAQGVLLVGLRADMSIRTDELTGQGDTRLAHALADVGALSADRLFPATLRRGLGTMAVDGVDVDLSRVYRIRLAAGANVHDAAAILRDEPAVAYAEPDYLAQLVVTPNDPQFSSQWGLTKISAPDAWDVTTGESSVPIAVIDSGIDIDHADLSDQLWTNPGEIPENGVDDDNNGCIDDIHGWNIVDDNADLADNTGHGTQVAGIIAAATNNSTDVAGVCWNCQLMPVKVTQVSGVANYSDIAAGVLYASQKGAKVINLSVGGYADSTTLRAAIAAASETAVVVAGAGNDNQETPFYPAAYGDDVLAIAGTTQEDVKVGTSNYGTWVGAAAPGTSIVTTLDGGGSGTASGTSMAAGFASGLAGLLRSQHDDWSAHQTWAHIVQTADSISSYSGKMGSGRINAGEAVNTTPEPILTFDSYTLDDETTGRPDPGKTVEMVVTLFNEWGDATNVHGTLSTSDSAVNIGTNSASFGDIGAYSKGENSTSFVFTVAAGAGYNHAINFTLNVTADDGYSATIPFVVTTANGIETVSGIINSNTTWTNDRVYVVTGNVLVNSGVTLTIEPGTTIKFEPEKSMRIDGTLIARGTATQRIIFTSNTTNPPDYGDWVGLQFTSSATFDSDGNYVEGNIIEYAIVEYANGVYGWGAIVGGVYVHYATIQYTPCAVRNAVIDASTIRYNGTGAVLEGVGSELRGSYVISNDSGALIVRGGARAISNTLMYNDGGICDGGMGPMIGVVCLEQNDGDEIDGFEGNNLLHNLEEYDLNVNCGSDVDVANNYWGTTDTNTIDGLIWDQNDNFDRGRAIYQPILTEPEPTAPAFLWQVSHDPASTVGIQQVTFNLRFSRPMDQSINPTVTFGATSPYDRFQISDNAEWVDGQNWQATYDITSLVPRGTHTLNVSGARGTDGLEIPSDTRFTFIVDYAGSISDQTPPFTPSIYATGDPSDTSYFRASWSASDGESAIVRYRYAVGTAPGAKDIINWTTVTQPFSSRSNLGLIPDRTYWVSVQAQNAGGLWSASGQRSFVSGVETRFYVYLPVALKE
jgi:subtilisin family serine protease